MDRRAEPDPELVAELEDRAAEQVDRDWLLTQDRGDWDEARADAEREAECLTDRAEFARREAERDALWAGWHPREYGHRL